MDANVTIEREIARKELTADGPIVLYDGDCGLCAKAVKWVMKHDRDARFRFAPLQGETAERLVGPPEGTSDTWSFLLVDESGVSDRSTAALRVLKRTGWGGFLPSLGLAIPRFLRDGVYRVVAKVRYRFWGKANACALPTKSQLTRFMP